MAYGVVYKTTNLIDDKIYVGQTKRTVEVRFKEQARENSVFGSAIRKYGAENFKREILEECNSQSELDEREKFWIAKLDCKVPKGYNVTDDGSGRGGYVPTSEFIANMSKAAKIREAKRTPEEKSMIAKKGWAKKTPEERSELARKREAKKTPEERRKSALKAAATRKTILESKTLEERRQMTENARLALKLRTHEERVKSAKKLGIL